MTVVGSARDGDYWPEFGTLVVRDPAGPEDEYGDPSPIGTIARTGHGWLKAAAGDGPCEVLLQVHDGKPEGLAWDALLELPFVSTSGQVVLTDLIGGADNGQLKLGEAGHHRVRIAHQPLEVDEDDDESPVDRWQLDFWRVDEAEPPRWFHRERPAVFERVDPNWRHLVSFHAMDPIDCLWSAQSDGDGATVAELAAWGVAHQRGDNWLDEQLHLSTHRGQMPLADIAAQLQLPAPTTPRGLLPLFVALGYLLYDGERYRFAPEPPMPQDVLEIPADDLATLELAQSTTRYGSFAADLVSVAYWGGIRQTVSSLAERTIAGEADVEGALTYAVGRGWIRLDGPLSGEFVITALSKEA
ncbi:hypothetical protein AB0E69_09330 [Kribbella sp. NPDC026611]|uniref:hypothetical protein n=1 Tax=Kribbella sp. NPDC026611 TaxID=3154911 RepID=UPI0033E507E6